MKIDLKIVGKGDSSANAQGVKSDDFIKIEETQFLTNSREYQ